MSKMDDTGIRQFVVAADDDGIRLDRWFKRHLPDATFNLVSRWARTGQLRVDGKRATPGDRIAAGQAIRVPPADAAAVAAAKPARKRRVLTDDEMAFARDMVIFKDDAALVINKPPGLAAQGGTKTTEHVDGLLDALFFELDMRPKLVHRLDKDTSGALLLARSSRSAGHFAKAFSSRTARKVYWALVVGVPAIEDGFIELPIGKQPGTGGEKMHVDEENGQSARTRYRVIERAGNTAAWVECPIAAYGGDWAPDCGRRQIWRKGCVPDRHDQPQNAPARPPHSNRPSQGASYRCHRQSAAAYRREF
jgi:23S rRNA pseudouridine955/2504/2580 synthase